jgi:hypothetical protein
MGPFGFLAFAVIVYGVLQIVALRVTDGVLWRIAFGVAIPAAASVIVGVIGMAAGMTMAPMYYLLFAPIGAGVLALILGAHVIARLRQR